MNIIHLVSNKVWGGGEQYVLDLASEQQSRGHNVSILSRGFDAVDEKFISASLPVSKAPLRGAVDFVSPFRLARLLAANRGYTVIHAHNFKDAVTACRARRIAGRDDVKVIVTRHQVKAAKTGVFHERLYRNIDAIVFVSALARDVFLSGKPGADRDKLKIVFNSVKPKHSDAPLRSHSPLRLIYIGRISPEKGVDVLVEALSQIRDHTVLLDVVGTGDEEYMAELQSLAEKGGVESRVFWHGHQRNVYDFVDQAHIGVCPTRCREAFGLAVIECMACGVPVVATNNGAPVEYIEDGENGMLVSPEDPKALAAAIDKLVANPELRKRIGEKAKSKFDNDLAYNVFYDNIMRLYQA